MLAHTMPDANVNQILETMSIALLNEAARDRRIVRDQLSEDSEIERMNDAQRERQVCPTCFRRFVGDYNKETLHCTHDMCEFQMLEQVSDESSVI